MPILEIPLWTDPLTRRESQIVRFLARGLIAKDIADRLGISKRTVDFHQAQLYRKLGVNNRADAVLVAVRHGYLG